MQTMNYYDISKQSEKATWLPYLKRKPYAYIDPRKLEAKNNSVVFR